MDSRSAVDMRHDDWLSDDAGCKSDQGRAALGYSVPDGFATRSRCGDTHGFSSSHREYAW